MDHLMCWAAMLVLGFLIIDKEYRLRQANRDLIEADNRWRNDWIRGIIVIKADTVKEVTRHEYLNRPPDVRTDPEMDPMAEGFEDVDDADARDFAHLDSSMTIGGASNL